MATTAQARGQIVSKRLNLLNNYLLKEADSGKSLPQFMSEKGITSDVFFGELPGEFKSIPGMEKEDIRAYAEALNDLYYRQYLIHMGEASFSVEGDGPCGANKCLHPSGSCIRCVKGKAGNGGVQKKNGTHSCNGSMGVDGLPVGSGVVREGDQYYASGCGLPPLKPLSRDIPKNKEKWDKYRKKKAEYEKCRAAKKEDKKAGKPEDGKRGLHALNKYNPLYVAGRNGFLALVKLNFRNLAVNFHKMSFKKGKGGPWAKLMAKWYNLGGDTKALVNVISKGRTRKPFFGVKKGVDGAYSVAGVDDGAIVAWLTSASGVLAAVAPIVKQFKKEEGEPLGDEVPTETGGVGSDIPDTTDDGDAPEDVGFWTKKNIFIAVGVSIGVVALGWLGYSFLNSKKKSSPVGSSPK